MPINELEALIELPESQMLALFCWAALLHPDMRRYDLGQLMAELRSELESALEDEHPNALASRIHGMFEKYMREEEGHA